MLHRRTFLQTATAGTIGTLAAFSQLTTPVAARKLSKIGVQLYTVRDLLSKDFEGTLRQVAGLGFKQVEFAGYFNRTPQQVSQNLQSLGLAAPSAHVSLAELRDNLSKAVETAQAVGHKLVVCPFLMPNERKTIEDYKRHAATLNRAAAAFKAAKIEFGYHNHDFEFMPVGGQMPMDVLLKETDPALVKIELDLYWIIKAKQDPLAFIAQNPGRIVAFHVKDMDKATERFTEVGRGTINFKPIFAKANQAGVKYFFVEQDTCPGNPLDSLKISADYLKTFTF